MDNNPLPADSPAIEPEVTPTLPVYTPKKSSPLLPMFLGVVIVVIISAVLAGMYYFAKLKKEVSNITVSPPPSPTASPSLEPTSTPSASMSPQDSIKPSVKPTSTPKSTVKPSPSTSPTPTPSPITTNSTLDIRFGNPSAHVKQTYDDGSGVGRVINREYSSIQVGEFDEVKAVWSPKVTVCFHVISNQELDGSKLGYTITEDDKVAYEGTLSQYAKVEAGKIYDVCHDTTTSLGSHTLRLTINNTKSLGEATYANNTARLDYKNLADNIAPNFTLIGPNNEGSDGTCLFPQYISDNVTPTASLKVEQKIDNNDWSTYASPRYCFKGASGSTHTYAIRITDDRGNKTEQSSTFHLF